MSPVEGLSARGPLPALLTLVELLTVPEAAYIGHVSVGMAWKLVGPGEWPSFHVSRNRLVPCASLEALLNDPARQIRARAVRRIRLVPPPAFFETGPQFLTILRRQRDDAVGHGQEDRAELLEGLIDDIDSDA